MPDAAFDRLLERAVPGVIEDAIRISEIPAPTFREGERARYVHARLEALGPWERLSIDRAGNVVAIRAGAPSRGGLLVAAHLDTVFPDERTPVARRRGRLEGRGIGDNAVSVAALLAVAEALQSAPPRGLGDVVLAANVCEEGLGDLRGVRALLDDHADRVHRLIAVEGLSLDRVQVRGVASRRYELSVDTDGGHSWGAYGRPNAIALLARAIVALEPLMPDPRARPRTTMNVGVVQGGRSVNTIAPDARCELDLRSEDADALARLDRAVKRAVRAAVGDGGRLRVRRIGDRPGGAIDEDDPLVRAVLRARRESGLERPELSAGSTDANAGLGRGIPSTCIGVTTGGDPHTPREWMRTAPLRRGVPYLGRAIAHAARLGRP